MDERRRARGLWIPLACAMALFALLRFRLEQEPDLGWHLAQGRLLAQGHWLRTNALSWTAGDALWVDTSWLFDLITYLSTLLCPELWGPKLFIASLFAAMLAFSGLAALEVSSLGAWLLPALTLLLSPRATPRPQVASYAALACVLWLCLRARANAPAQRDRWLALIPIWLGGLFHPGAAFAAAPLGFFCLEALWRERREPGPRWPRLAKTLGPALFAPLALLLNPAGPASLVHLVRHWDLGSVVQIAEFQPWRFALEPVLPFAVALALLGLAPGLRHRSLAQPALAASVLLFALLALRTLRLTYECVLVCAPALALLIEQVGQLQRRSTAALVLALVTLLSSLHHGLLATLAAPRFEPRWNEEMLPVRAAKFLDAHGLRDHGFNGLRDGGYLAWARPGVPIFIDARIHAYPPALWRAFAQAEKASAAFDRFLRDEGAEWALVRRQREPLAGVKLLDNPPGWALVYWDEVSELFARRDVPALQGLVASFEYKRFHPWGDLLSALERFDAPSLAALDAELARFRETAPRDGTALLFSCATATKEARADAASLCDLAEQEAADEQNAPLAALIQRVRNRPR